jgi:hypothetical protein
MPADQHSAFLWAKHIGTLVSYETFLRQYPTASSADEIRRRIRGGFVPAEEEWLEEWLKYSRADTITGAMVHPEDGLMLLGKRGEGRLPPFLTDDLIVALRCIRAAGAVSVTMIRIFPARFHQPGDTGSIRYGEYETSVEFRPRGYLSNTHLAFVLFEGDRMLKSLAAGFDIFRGEPIRSSVPGFATETEMASEEPAPSLGEGLRDYGRVWIELTSVKISTTDKKNVARFSNVKMEVRAESKHAPPIKFAKHLEDHYSEYAREFVIFAEVERAARIVAIAQWLAEHFPAEARKLADDSLRPVKVVVPQVIRARFDKTHDTPSGPVGLIGGVVLSAVNHYEVDPNVLMAETPLSDVARKVVESKPRPDAHAWSVQLGTGPDDIFIAWKVTVPSGGDDKVTSAGRKVDTSHRYNPRGISRSTMPNMLTSSWSSPRRSGPPGLSPLSTTPLPASDLSP